MLIITKLDKRCKDIKLQKLKKNIRKRRTKDSSYARSYLEYNCYITNVPREFLETTQVHDMYSLRWQIELMFKIWKSIFKIDKIKKVKINRFKCFLYGRLISLLLTAGIVFTIKRDVINTTGDEISEMSHFQSYMSSSINYVPPYLRGN